MMKHTFQAKIYRTGINWCVNVPAEITTKMIPEKGYIRIKGRINGFDFRTSLVPVKNAPYRLFVNLEMMKGGKTALGEVAQFSVEQDTSDISKIYPMPDLLAEALDKNGLNGEFEKLTPSRKKDILKYLHYIKTEETLKRNVDKVIEQLKSRDKDVRIP